MEAQSSQLAYAQPANSRALRVLFDGRKLGDGGIGVYIDNTVTGLLERGDVDLTVIARPDQVARVSWHKDVAWIFDKARPYSLAEYFLLARRIDHARFDLFHAPHYTLPFGVRIPSVVTIHDLIHIEHPEQAYYPFVASPLIRSAVKRSAAVIAVSEATKKAVQTLCAVGDARISVIPNAIPLFLEDACDDQNECHRLEQLVGKAPYFVAVLSNIKPHKGVEQLIAGYVLLRNRLAAEGREQRCPQLFLVGYGAESIKETKPELYQQLCRLEGVSIVGAVERTSLRTLYAGSVALVVASRAEGFCFPALEAQSVGTRVVCTPVPALLELTTDRDLVADDFSSESLARVMHQAACVPVYDRSIDTNHLARFALRHIADQTYQLYQSVMQARVMNTGEGR